jgi:DNA repair exonuclease SbcCD ATPase subunit
MAGKKRAAPAKAKRRGAPNRQKAKANAKPAKAKPAKAKPATAKPTKAKPAKAKPAAARRAQATPSTAELALLREELEAARRELARIGSVENHARRDLEAQALAQDSVEQRLRAELDAVKLDLRTALAELEIARAAEARAVERAMRLGKELEEARASERRAQHALDVARDQLVDLQRATDAPDHADHDGVAGEPDEPPPASET